MYWSEWGRSGSIKKASMDGGNRTTLVFNSGHAVLAIDNESRRLYWTDLNVNTSVIISADLNGLNKKILLNETGLKISGLAIYKEFLYWSDDANGNVCTMLVTKFTVICVILQVTYGK